ncbi:MAG: ABC-2 transporter permease [Verrucomicrobia bacterium]|jgi:ABC-2 type transport system permease protein|nr:ABC-2 transporter permease [Verrucomicrobiota bacterium]
MLLLANIKKELLLLSRDRAGLLVLFVMPMLLVLVLSLVQDDIFRATGEAASRALFANLDRGTLGEALGDALEQSGDIELVRQIDEVPLNADSARRAVFNGDYQFAIVIPEQFSSNITAAAEATVQASIRNETNRLHGSQMVVYFDPIVRGVYRTSVMNALQRGVSGLEFAEKGKALGHLMPEAFQRRLDEEFAAYGEPSPELDLPEISDAWARQALIQLEEESAYPPTYTTVPTSVQQNVPAWTLFGMFFIVLPLAGTLIRERQEGTLLRLMTMQVGNLSLLLGKVLAHMFICLVQFGLMLAVGMFLLPLLGTPVLELGSAPFALLLVATSAALAACGYGIVVGVLARSYEQVSTFGAVSVVIAAALGGVMVPVYMMPRAMQNLSVVSPLGWGLNAFLDIFVRGGNLASVLPRVVALGSFFLLCMLFAVLAFRRWRRGG